MDVPETVGRVLAHLEHLSVMDTHEFELTPPEPVLYLCRWCIDAGPEHLDHPHTCQKAWGDRMGSERKCECPCGEIYAGKNRLLIYCNAIRIHARLAHDAMKRARKDARCDMNSAKYYRRISVALQKRQDAWLVSEKTIADVESNNKTLRAALEVSRNHQRQAEVQRDLAMADVYTQTRLAIDYKKKADEYDKLMKPRESTGTRHIILDDES